MSLKLSLASKYEKKKIRYWMEKKGHVFKNWRKRYFVLDMNYREGYIYYYANAGDESRDVDPSVEKGVYQITSTSTVEKLPIFENKTNVIRLTAMKRNAKQELEESVLIFTAAPRTTPSSDITIDQSSEIADMWVDAISEIISGVLVSIPEIGKSFRNRIPLKISYIHQQFTVVADEGCLIEPEYASKSPSIEFAADPASYHAIVMIDPDAPSVHDPQYRQFVHWIVLNIPGNNLNSGLTVAKYVQAGPAYNSGYHRYIFLLFDQGRRLDEEELRNQEVNFGKEGKYRYRGKVDIREWAREFGDPIGINGFVSGWTPFIDDLHDSLKFLPPEEYRSPLQQEKFAKEEAEREFWKQRRLEESLKAQADAEANKKKLIEVRESLENKAANEVINKRLSLDVKMQFENQLLAVQRASNDDPTLAALIKYDIETRDIFDGVWMFKKFSYEWSYRKRFCWIDEASNCFFWSRTEGKLDPKRKYVNLLNDVNVNGIRSLGGARWKIKAKSGSGTKSLCLEVIGYPDNVSVASEWIEVAGYLNAK